MGLEPEDPVGRHPVGLDVIHVGRYGQFPRLADPLPERLADIGIEILDRHPRLAALDQRLGQQRAAGPLLRKDEIALANRCRRQVGRRRDQEVEPATGRKLAGHSLAALPTVPMRT